MVDIEQKAKRYDLMMELWNRHAPSSWQLWDGFDGWAHEVIPRLFCRINEKLVKQGAYWLTEEEYDRLQREEADLTKPCAAGQSCNKR